MAYFSSALSQGLQASLASHQTFARDMMASAGQIPATFDPNDFGGSINELVPVFVYVGIPIALGIIFMLLGPVFACLTWLCRCCNCPSCLCCGKCCGRCCGGRKPTIPANQQYSKKQMRTLMVVFFIFTAGCVAGAITGISGVSVFNDGIEKLFAVILEMVNDLLDLVRGLVNRLGGVDDVIREQVAPVNRFALGMESFYVPIDSITTVLNSMDADLTSISTGITGASADLAVCSTELTTLTNILTTFSISASPPSSSDFPDLGSSGTDVANAQSDLQSTNTTLTNMRVNVEDAIVTIMNNTGITLNSTADSVGSALDSVSTMFNDYLTMGEDYQNLIVDYNKQVVGDLSSARRQGLSAIYYLGLLLFAIGIVAFFLKGPCCARFFAFLCFILFFYFFLLHTLEVTVAGAFDLYCLNEPYIINDLLPTVMNSTMVGDLLYCSGNTNLLDILNQKDQFNMSRHLNMTALLDGSSDTDRSADIANAQSDLNSVSGTLGSVSIDTTNVANVYSSLANVQSAVSALTSFVNVWTGSQITSGQVGTATTNMNTIKTAPFLTGTLTLSSCAGNSNNDVFGCGASTCVNIAGSLTLATLGAVSPAGAANAGAVTLQCPFTDLTASQQSNLLSTYAPSYPVYQAAKAQSDINDIITDMTARVQSVENFATVVSQFVGTAVPTYMGSISDELVVIGNLSTQAGANVTLMGNEILNNMQAYFNTIVDLGQCSWVGDAYGGIKSSICEYFTPGLKKMSWGNFTIGICLMSAFYISLVSIKRKRHNQKLAKIMPTFVQSAQTPQ